MKTKIFRLVLLTLFIFSTFILSNKTMASNDWVIFQCFAPQGNGGNYASTLGWMSETVQIRVQEAIDIENATGQNVKINMGCMTGGSSGSQSTGIMMNLLQNQNLVPGAHVDHLFSPVEAQIIADALRFMSITADAAALEMINTYKQYIIENLEGKILSTLSKVDFLNSFANDVLGNQTPNWWDTQSANGDHVLVDFLTTSLLASTMDLDLLYGDRLSNSDYNELFAFAKFGGNRNIHLERYSNYEEIPRNSINTDDYFSADADLKERASSLNSNADKFISSQFNWGAFKSRYWLGAYNAPKPLKSVSEKPMAKGFCTITMGILYSDQSDIDLNQPPNYNDTRAIVMCSAETIDLILNQPDFLSDLEENPFSKKFILAEAKNLRGALALSLREPFLMTELTGKVGSKRIELASYFDPKIHSVPRRNKFNGEVLAVVGGWPDRRVSAWISSYYLLNNVDKFRADGYEVKGYMSMFGKPDNREVDKFDTRSIRTIFSDNPEDAESNLADWFEFQDTYCTTFLPRFDSEYIEDETIAFNWDITKIPAAQSGHSRYLTTMAINATQLQNVHNNSQYVFDSYIEDGYIQDYDMIPCTY